MNSVKGGGITSWSTDIALKMHSMPHFSMGQEQRFLDLRKPTPAPNQYIAHGVNDNVFKLDKKLEKNRKHFFGELSKLKE